MSKLHKQATHLITTLHAAGVRTLVIGDVRDLRQTSDVGHTNNQKIHQWSAGSVRFKLTYKARHLGMEVVSQEEAYTSRTFPCAALCALTLLLSIVAAFVKRQPIERLPECIPIVD